MRDKVVDLCAHVAFQLLNVNNLDTSNCDTFLGLRLGLWEAQALPPKAIQLEAKRRLLEKTM